MPLDLRPQPQREAAARQLGKGAWNAIATPVDNPIRVIAERLGELRLLADRGDVERRRRGAKPRVDDSNRMRPGLLPAGFGRAPDAVSVLPQHCAGR